MHTCSHLGVEDVQNGGAVGDAVEQHGERDRADDDDAAVLGAVDSVRSGVAAVFRRRQQGVPIEKRGKGKKCSKATQ